MCEKSAIQQPSRAAYLASWRNQAITLKTHLRSRGGRRPCTDSVIAIWIGAPRLPAFRDLWVLQDHSRLASVIGFRVSIDESLQGQIRNGELFLPHGRHGFLKQHFVVRLGTNLCARPCST
jgi:hypothetical protein